MSVSVKRFSVLLSDLSESSPCCTRRVEDHAERLRMSVSASSCKASELTSTSRLPSATPALALGRPPITGTALHRDIVCCNPRAYAITRDHEHIVLASAPLSDLEFGSAFGWSGVAARVEDRLGVEDHLEVEEQFGVEAYL